MESYFVKPTESLQVGKYIFTRLTYGFEYIKMGIEFKKTPKRKTIREICLN